MPISQVAREAVELKVLAVPAACLIDRSTAGTYGHSRTSRYVASSANRQADPLRKPTCDETPRLAGDCMEIVAGVFGWPNAGNAPLTSPLAIMGARWHARTEFHSSAGATSVA